MNYRLLFLICLYSIYTGIFAQQNTILIIADDVSPDYFGFYNESSDTANTPNLRKLVKKGVLFNKAWANPLCSPTRAGILTGKYAFRTGIGNVISSSTSPQIDTAEMSISKLLKYYAPKTYSTACVGKWHLTWGLPAKYSYPNKLGFDFYSGNFNGGIQNYSSYNKITNGKVIAVTTYATTETVNDAIGWLDTTNSTKPFFLWLAFNAPHTPLHLPPTHLITNTTLTGTTEDIAAEPHEYFKAAIEAMDSEIGRLIAYLETHGLYENTNFIFIGDNGSSQGTSQNPTPSKSKNTVYNYGVRVPMLIAGPAVIDQNRKSDALVNTVDLFATISELSGLSNWKSAIPSSKLPIDSKSILPIIENKSAETRNWIFTEMFTNPADVRDGKSIRNAHYHLMKLDNGTEEFYNQTLDFYENNNLLNGNLTEEEQKNYYQLCDSLSSLLTLTPCSNSLSISDQQTLQETIITPNPSADVIYISSSQKISKIECYDSQGQKLNETTNTEISLKQFETQLLLVKVYYTDTSFSIHKLIKQ